MKKISIMILVLVATMASCKKTPEVNLKYVDVERDLVTVGTTTANIQCDYDYIATLKKAYLFYGEGEEETNMASAEMRVVQNSLYVELTGLKQNTTYCYYYEFFNGFNSMRSALKIFKTEAPPIGVTLPTVVTAAVTDITTSSAKSGGEVTNDGGAEVTERGICWSTNANPTLNDSHITVGAGTGAFTAVMSGLNANTTYHVRAYAINEKGTAYGLNKEFKTPSGGGGDHEYVDLGLPSGTLWATCNVGANAPEEYGDYFAWGETEPKDDYEWSTYKYANGATDQLTKYCTLSEWGFNGFVDNLSVLLPEDDAATVNWGVGWCTPSKEQWEELEENTVSVWTTQNGKYGLLATASNGKSVFLPAAGHTNLNNIGEAGYNAGEAGYYWSRIISLGEPANAHCLYLGSSVGVSGRDVGLSVRPVRKNGLPIPPGDVPEGAINGLFTINANGDQVYFSQGNLQYQASTNTWRFAENQWDYVGGDTYGTVYENGVKCNNELISSSYNGWIDLFGWGTSGYYHGAVCYQPWSTSTDFNDYYAYGEITYCLYEQNGQADWGYNRVINGGNQEHLWRTLSEAEWGYVFGSRNTVSGVRYVKAKVNEIIGVILLPDDWDIGVYMLENPNYYIDTVTNNFVSAEDWINIFEPAGAVFFPSTMLRYGSAVDNVNPTIVGQGYYWGSSYRNSDYLASVINFYQIFDPCFHEYRRNGCSVRLVQDANPQNKAK